MQESEGSPLERALRLQSGRVGFEAVLPNPKLKLLDQVREVLRLRHYSIRTEQSYCDWIRRYVRFHRMQTRAELTPGEAKVEQFLSDLAVNGHVAAATQNQAFNALLFLYREVLQEPEDGLCGITELYLDKFRMLPAGKRIFIRTVQQINGWRDLPKTISARVLA